MSTTRTRTYEVTLSLCLVNDQPPAISGRVMVKTAHRTAELTVVVDAADRDAARTAAIGEVRRFVREHGATEIGITADDRYTTSCLGVCIVLMSTTATYDAATYDLAARIEREARTHGPDADLRCTAGGCRCYGPADYLWAAPSRRDHVVLVPICKAVAKQLMGPDSGLERAEVMWPLPGHDDIKPLTVAQYDELVADIDRVGLFPMGGEAYAAKTLTESGPYGVALLRVSIDALLKTQSTPMSWLKR